jgi:hypothetical protein
VQFGCWPPGSLPPPFVQEGGSAGVIFAYARLLVATAVAANPTAAIIAIMANFVFCLFILQKLYMMINIKELLERLQIYAHFGSKMKNTFKIQETIKNLAHKIDIKLLICPECDTKTYNKC